MTTDNEYTPSEAEVSYKAALIVIRKELKSLRKNHIIVSAIINFIDKVLDEKAPLIAAHNKRQEVLSQQDEIKKLREANEVMLEALKYYKDHKLYEDENGCASARSRIFYDDGFEASTTLAKVQEIMGNNA